MYRPNFCSQCGKKIIRLHWHPWSSSRFCDPCSKPLRKERLMRPLTWGLLLFSIGLIAGRAGRPKSPPLVIQRVASAPETLNPVTAPQALASPLDIEEEVYLCGARTKKGTACSRRVQGPVRCWQHKGMPAMLPPEKLIVK